MMKKLIAAVTIAATCMPLNAANTYSGYELASEGAWCWFADPRAIHYESPDKSINASYIGYIDVHGNVKATQFDFNNGGKRSEVLVRSYFQPDDHNNPTFLVLPDKRILIIYSRHTDEKAFYYRVSNRPGDISDLGPEKKIVTKDNTTYPSPFILSDDPDHFYLCWRGIGWHPTIARFTIPDANGDVKCVWGAYQMVQSTGARPYAKYYSNGKDKIYVTYTTGHPDNEQPNWVYFNVININASKATDGSVIVKPTLEDIKGNTLKTISDGTFAVNKTASYKNSYPNTVVDATDGIRDWVWQIATDNDGKPVIAMVKIDGGKSQHDYYYAKWTGNEWRVSFLANGGGKFHSSNTEYCYSGGMAVDPENVNDIYLSIPTVGNNGSVYEIWKYTVDNSGNVTAKQQITSNSLKNNVRPYILPDSKNSPLRLGWMNGDYYYWIVKKEFPAGFPTDIRSDYNYIPSINVSATTPVSSVNYGMASVTASDSKAISLPSGSFSLNINLALSPDNYGGTIVKANGFNYGVNKSDAVPYIEINGTRYSSSNKLYTSDSWATNSTGTSGDDWPTKLGSLQLSITFDGSTVTIYRNGLIDQKISCGSLNSSNASIGGFDGQLGLVSIFNSCLSQDELKYAQSTEVLNSLSVPEKVYTDLVLPSKVGGQNVIWTSSNQSIISDSGIFNAPSAETPVTLTATIGGNTKTFNVKAMPRDIKACLLASYGFSPSDLNGNKVRDLSGNNNDLTVMGSAKVDGTLNLQSNAAGNFTSNGYGLLPEGILKNLRSYTICFDANANSLSGNSRFYDLGGNNNNSLFCRTNTLAAGIKYNGGTTTMVDAGNVLNTGQNYNIAVTFDVASGMTTIYVDGREVSSGSQNVNEPYMLAEVVTDNRNYIGRTQWWDTSFAKDNVDFSGTIDNLKIYCTALTAGELAELLGIEPENPALDIDMTDRLVNPGFEGSYEKKSGTNVNSDRAIYLPEGWELAYSNGDSNDLSVLDSSCLYYSLFSAVPSLENGGRKTYLIRQRWGNSTISLNQKVENLPAAYYSVSADTYRNGNGDAYISSSNKENKTDGNASAEKWGSSKTYVSINGNEPLTIGLTSDHSADGELISGFDNFTLKDVTLNRSASELDALLSRMVKAAQEILNSNHSNESNRSALAEATKAAEERSSDADKATLLSLYTALRDAIKNMKNQQTGVVNINSEAEDTICPVYDLSGRFVGIGTDGLEPGIYIRNRAKILIK